MSDLTSDTVDTASLLQSMYGLSEKVTTEIMAASPYAGYACTFIDSSFVRIVEAQRARGDVTALQIKVLSDLVHTLLGKAQEEPEVVALAYLTAGFGVLGNRDRVFPEGLGYPKALAAMQLLLPRLVEIKLELMMEHVE